MLMTIWVGAGSFPPPKSLNIFSNTGMTLVRRMVTTIPAMKMTAMG